ncbi:HAMP domain-containing protein [Desulfosporosinus fructosivorans]|uniref:histidine kinase n=1 Tax=Desulfosporosinus fructosivorans TaxID=2018669 RepID=A0A4Z0QWT5_9FIRM|nr:ATP-binding protein [Desulfosporosinus fructosivorans]TGE34769.1 HAMP domain-containing protein [Desulfosporosinus fructosivorans]
MKKNIFLRRILKLVIGTIVLYGVLSLVISTYFINNMFDDLQVQELKPRAKVIADLMIRYQQGAFNKTEFDKQLGIYNTIWNNATYIYDTNGNLIIKNYGLLLMMDNSRMEPEADKVFRGYLTSVLSGNNIVDNKNTIPVVGLPIINDGKITGAVFVATPPSEQITAFLGITRALVLSTLGVLLLIIYPVYQLTRRIVNPLKQMQNVAISMAHGNLEIKANEDHKDEIGELGYSLNYLSERLAQTISVLEVERNRLKQTIDGLSEGIIAIDPENTITHANPAIHQIFAERNGDKLADILPIQELGEDFDTVLALGYTIARNIEWEKTTLRVTMSPIADETLKIVGAVGLFQDITLAERLEQTRHDYVANVSHELRTPISALRALLETLIDDMIPDEGTKKRYYSLMMHETMRLSRLINDLLTLSRLQTDAIPAKKAKFLLNEVIENLAEQYFPLAKEKEIEFSFSQLPEDLLITSNQDFVEEILIILLDNAIKYTPSGGSISLCTALHEKSILIAVSDTGIGISTEDLPHIFERFYKCDKAHATQGSGLGLAIAYEIIQKLGEKITVESELGKGSKFAFTLSDI